MSTDSSTIGKFRLVNCLASGQHSQVWEAVDSETTRRVAMKVLLPEFLKVAEQVGSLKNEFKVGKSFEHPNIIKYYELAVNKQHAYFTMELFNAPNLKAQAFNDLHGIHMRLRRLVELVAMALEHIHEKGWIHRDLKPENILMNKSSEVRVIDFSLASRAAGAFSKVFSRKLVLKKGTRTYMAPEQIMGRPLTIQTDIYNFGVTLFELLTGEPPFKGSTPKDLLLRHMNEPAPAPSEFNSNVSEDMDRVIMRMLSKKPEQRHKKMSEFLVEFRNVKIFKEDVTEKVALTDRQRADQEVERTLGERLDSRTDALRTKHGIKAPPKPEKRKSTIKAPAQPAPQRSPAAPGGPPAMQPMMPQYMPMAPLVPQQYQMPMAPYPMPQMPQGPVPWVAAGPGGQMPMPVWGQQPQPATPNVPAGGAAAAPPPVAPPQRPRPPVAPLVAPAVAPAATAKPAAPLVQPRPQPVAPAVPPAATKPPVKKPPAPVTKPEQGIKIDDLLGFDELPPAS